MGAQKGDNNEQVGYFLVKFFFVIHFLLYRGASSSWFGDTYWWCNGSQSNARPRQERSELLQRFSEVSRQQLTLFLLSTCHGLTLPSSITVATSTDPIIIFLGHRHRNWVERIWMLTSFVRKVITVSIQKSTLLRLFNCKALKLL